MGSSNDGATTSYTYDIVNIKANANAGTEADDGLAGRLEGLGACVDGHGGRFGDGADPPREW